MDTILRVVQQRETVIALVVGAVLGLLLGLAIGWWWWPVEWVNSTPGNLRQDFQDDYIVWVADQFTQNASVEWAQGKLGVEYWKEGQLAETLERVTTTRSGQEAANVQALAVALEAAPAPLPEPGTVGGTALRSVALVCGAAILVLALVGGAVFLFSRLSGTQAGQAAPAQVGVAPGRVPVEEVSWGLEGPPLTQFATTYNLGDDHYDPSFSIELENGEFMGECGVGISETIGVGAPSKVTAFEVWLFDKNDIRTVTKVLMSDYAFNEEGLRTKLAPKGEPVSAEPRKDIILETKTLRVRARIVEVEYGAGDLPPNSFFERLTVDLATWAIADQAG